MSKKIIIAIIIIIAIAISSYFILTRVIFPETTEETPKIIESQVTTYTADLDYTKVHQMLANHLQENYMLSLEELTEDIEIIGKDCNRTLCPIIGFFSSYEKEGLNILTRITSEQSNRLTIYIFAPQGNVTPELYFKVNSMSGTKDEGTFEIIFSKEEPNMVTYIYSKEGIYSSVFKEQ